MISSPGCLCLKAGASGLMSTRFWTTSRPGMLRSCCWRSVRSIPDACCSLRLLPRGEVTALVDLVEVGDVGVGVLDPAARGPPDLAGEGGEAHRQRDFRRSLGGCACLSQSLSVLPVRPGR